MKKVLFAITNLDIGGAEKVLVNLVNNLKNDYDITVLTLYNGGQLEETINKKVKIKSILNNRYDNMSFISKKLFALKIRMPFFKKKIYKQINIASYDTVISFLEGPITELLKEASNKKIAWIHTDLTEHYPKTKYNYLINVYKKYDELIFVSQNSLDKFLVIDKDNECKATKKIIYNYIDEKNILKNSKESIDIEFSKSKNFVVVARLVEAKGIDRLMMVHKRLIDNGYMHHIYVIGDGPLRIKLEELQKEYKIEDTFHLLGKKMNPYPYIIKGDYFLLPSYYEGYPVSLIEAEILNQYILITDIASKEVVKDYPNKEIFPNTEEGIYNGLKKIIEEKKIRSKEHYTVTNNEKIIESIKQLIGGEK